MPHLDIPTSNVRRSGTTRHPLNRKPSYPGAFKAVKKAMTITAGFRVVDGILLCADTLYTGGMKIYETKIFKTDLKGGYPDHELQLSRMVPVRCRNR
jgi:20S proteasome alpha/beta subunit